MREMKDSRISWIGDLPSAWATMPIKYNFTLVAGATPDSHNPDLWDGDVNWITPADFKTEDVYVKEGSRKLSEIGFKSCSTSMIPAGSIIFSKRAPIGTVAINTTELCTNQGCLGLVKKSRSLDNKYYYYVLSIYPEVFNLFGSGTTFKEISATAFGEVSLPFPPINEQHRISTYLDAKCAEIDALTADIQSQIDTLEQYKRSVITEAVTKGLNKNVEMKESGIEWAEQIPAHWRTMHNKYLMHKVKEICPVYNGEDILSLTMRGIIVRDFELGGKMPASFDGYQIIHPGNLLMCLFDYDVTPRCIGYINNEGLTSPAYSQFVMEPIADAHYYYYYYLMLDFTKELLHLAKNLRHSFTEEQLGEINTVVPPVNEQREIAGYLDKKVANIDEAISLKNDQLSTLDDYKKSIIYEYVTGKKEVPAV